MVDILFREPRVRLGKDYGEHPKTQESTRHESSEKQKEETKMTKMQLILPMTSSHSKNQVPDFVSKLSISSKWAIKFLC